MPAARLGSQASIKARVVRNLTQKELAEWLSVAPLCLQARVLADPEAACGGRSLKAINGPTMCLACVY